MEALNDGDHLWVRGSHYALQVVVVSLQLVGDRVMHEASLLGIILRDGRLDILDPRHVWVLRGVPALEELGYRLLVADRVHVVRVRAIDVLFEQPFSAINK